MTRLPGSCGEFLQRLPSSKRLLFTESSGCVVSPHSHRGKIRLTKIFTKSFLSVNQQVFTDSCSFHAGLGRKGGGGISISLVLQKVRGLDLL